MGGLESDREVGDINEEKMLKALKNRKSRNEILAQFLKNWGEKIIE